MSSKPDHTPTLPHDRQEWITAQEYAAIRLCVPDSGTEWLDAMIRKSRRNKLMGQVLVGMDSENYGSFDDMASDAYAIADAAIDKGAPE